VQLIQPGAPLPPFEPSENGEPNSSEEQDNGAVVPTPHIVATANPSGSGSVNSTQAHKSYQFTGVVQSIEKDVWVINGQSVNTNQAAMAGNIKIGSVVKFNGYFNPDGTFVVTTLEDNTSDNKIQHRNDSGGNSSGSGTNGNEQPGGGEGGDSGGDSGH
jgi:hypothetical protein